MRLHYYRDRHKRPNFGDDLNPWLWDRVLPGIFGDDDGTLFLGIGTLLNDEVPVAPRTIVFGSGVGYGQGLPQITPTWTFCAVRGPVSAKKLHLKPEIAITDPAVLVSRFVMPNGQDRSRWAFMPHYHNANDSWAILCREFSGSYISPCWSVERVLEGIAQARILLTESLHGAVVADTLGVPWVAVHTTQEICQFKWQDWCQSVEVTYQPMFLSSWIGRLWRSDGSLTFTQRVRRWTKIRVLGTQLAWIARTARPLLSDRVHLGKLLVRYEDVLQRFRADVERGCYRPSAHHVDGLRK